MIIFCFFRSKPEPPHFLHGFSIMVPEPPQRRQVLAMEKKPVFCLTCPVPLQSGHIFLPPPPALPVPLHSVQCSSREYCISILLPYTASVNSICKSYRRFAPRAGPLLRDEPRLDELNPLNPPKLPPPNKLSNKSERPPPPPKMSSKPWNADGSKPPPIFLTPSKPCWS